jgi:putative ABC transport system permease protein
MKFRDFLIGWRLLLKEPGYSAVVMAGLGIGIAICFLLLGFVRYSFSYDKHVPANDQLYLVNVQFNYAADVLWSQQSPQTLVEAAARSGLPVKASGYVPITRSVVVDNVVHELELQAVSPGFPKMFGISPLSGSIDAVLASADGIALTERTARRLFAGDDALGKVVRIGNESFRILAILPTPPATTTTPYAALIGFNSSAFDDKFRKNLLGQWSQLAGKVYLQLPAGTSPGSVTKVLQDSIDRSPLRASFPATYLAQLGDRKLMEVRLCPLRDAYFQSDIQIDDAASLHGNKTSVLALAGVALLILALAVTNYVNLSTVRMLRRQREVAMRKVMGATVGRVAGQFLAESMLVSLISTIIGLVLARVLLGSFAVLVNRTLDSVFAPINLLAALLIGALVGLLAGAYPAWVALRVRVTQALGGRGNSETAAGQWARRVLTVVQFATAMGLTAVCIAIAWQTNYVTQLSPGFDVARLLHVDLPRGTNMTSQSNMAFRDALLRIPGVTGATSAREIVGRHDSNAIGALKQPGGSVTNIALKGVTPTFFQVFGIRAIAGRVFDPKIENLESESVVVNAAAAQALGFASSQAAVGQFVNDQSGGTPSRIVGVADEVRHTSLHRASEPVVYYISKDTRAVTIRFDGSVQNIELAVEALWKQYFPNDVLNMYRAQTFFDLDYADDLRMAKMLAASSFISIAIAAFGIYVLAAYGTQRRRREIVLRKLYGATRLKIARLVGREFFLLIVVSAVLALPLAALVIERYLRSFVERAPIHGWTLLAAFVVAAAIAQVSTLRHLLSAIRLRPSEALRD